MNKQLLTKVEKERVRACKDVLDSIVEILEERKKATVEEAFSVDSYDKQSWVYYQADRLGRVRTLNETINLLKVNNDD